MSPSNIDDPNPGTRYVAPKGYVSFYDIHDVRHFVRRRGVNYIAVGDVPDPDAGLSRQVKYTLTVQYEAGSALYFEFRRESARDAVRQALAQDDEVEWLS